MEHDIIIVGAGLCGLHAARRLQAAQRSVLVLEKSRGLGGRAATRRWDNRPVDHGAQFFTAKHPDFAAEVAAWEKTGLCHVWTHGFHRFAGGRLLGPSDDAFPRYACRQGMASLGRALGAPLGDLVRRESRVTKLATVDGRWQVTLDHGEVMHGRSLLLTPPPAQSSALLSGVHPAAAADLARHASWPCLALAASFPRTALSWQGIQAPGDDLLSWIGHDTGKRPDLHPDCTILMLHASPGFSTANANLPEADLAALLLRRASEITSHDWTSPAGTFVQRWRYALPAPTDAPGGPAVYATPAPLVVAGDWCAGGRIEGAWLAGRNAADQLLEQLS